MKPGTEQKVRYRPHRVDAQLLRRARAMRHEAAPAEQVLWWCLRDRRLNGFKFRRQFAVLNYVADFYCAECRLIVELDGDSHDGREKYDSRRTQDITDQGLRVIRFLNTDVFENLDGVLDAIFAEWDASAIREEAPHPDPLP